MEKRSFFIFQNLIALLVIAAVVILVLMQVNMARTMENLSRSIIDQTREQSEAELDQFFESVAEELLQLKEMGEYGLFDDLDPVNLNHQFVPLLAFADRISSVQIANGQGREYMLMRRKKDDVWINRLIQPDEELGEQIRTWSYYEDLEQESAHVIEVKADTGGKSPILKSWFQGAIKEAEGEIYWSSPEHFKTAERTGMSLSIRYESFINQGIDYVITLDLLLEDISRFTMKEQVTEHAESFVITREGELIGLPPDQKISSEDSLERYLLRPAYMLEHSALSHAVAIWQKNGGYETFQFVDNEETWWAGFSPVKLNDEQVLYSGVILPESDLLSNVARTRQMTLLGWGLIGILLLVMGSSYMRQRKSQELLLKQEGIIAEEKEKVRLEHEKAITEADRAERLKQVDKLKDEFLANTSHELRTPLNGIIGIAESLYDGVEKYSSEDLRSNLSMIVTSGRRLTTLVNDLLDFSKLKTHNLDLHLKSLDLRSMTDIVLKMSESLKVGKKIKLINNISPDLPAVGADEDRLMQILHNLIGNAVKFTDTGKVEVRAREQGDRILVEVVDTGQGIPPEKQAAIFNSFEQIDGEITRSQGGTGLGLTISRRLIELHGGSIQVESTVGQGSIFAFDLPISDREAEQSAYRPLEQVGTFLDEELVMPEEPREEKGDVIRILVVDDEPINLQVLINHLSSRNYSISVALNGEEALELLDRDRFDLVLLDVMMPGMSGYEVCQQIRKRFLPSELPVIMITAKNQVADLVQGLSFGANDYLAKPFSKNEFLARVKTHLNLLNINSAYGKFVPHEFLKALGHESILDVNLGDQTEQTVSVLFTDIRSYTTLSEKMSPVDNFGFINAYFGRMGPIIKKNSGIINHFLGDGIMALFPSNAAHAVQGAIDMQKDLRTYNQDRQSKGRMPIRVGMGIHTGKLMMGIIGDRERMDTGLISDTVNTSARLEGLTKYYGANVLISDQTLEMIEDPSQFNYRFLGKVQVKGKKKYLKVYDFFDGDDPETIARKLKTREDFEAGMKAYFDRDFIEAIKAFSAVIAEDPDDQMAVLYQERATRNAREGVPEDWNGVDLMENK